MRGAAGDGWRIGALVLLTAVLAVFGQPPALVIHRKVAGRSRSPAGNYTEVRRFWSHKQLNDSNNYQAGLRHHKVITVNATAEIPEPECEFKILRGGPGGEQISGTTLNSELYYRIACQPRQKNLKTSYCLTVFNCTVRSAHSVTGYSIIDENGCSLEIGLFEHVEYEDDLTAGIRNPYPIGFRGGSSTVRFNCATRLLIKSKGGRCLRHRCRQNEYIRGWGGNTDS